MTEPTPVRDDTETTTRDRRCPVCGVSFTPTGRQAYHSNACRQIAYRRRRAAPPPPELPAGQRRDRSVYRCDDCGARYHARQWCDDCHRPCRRLGIGGECTHCGEPLTVDELLGGEPVA
jgi:hypothetical protein